MEVKYDTKIDALYITLSEGKYDVTKKITDSILIDLSRDGKVMGIEILDASENIKQFNPSDIKFHLQTGGGISHHA